MRCISNQKITPEKSEMMKAFSVRTVGREGGGEGREGCCCCCCCLPLLLLFSLRGLRWVSRLRLFPLSFPVFVSDSLLLALLLVLSLSQPFFFFFFFPHPLFIPPHPALGLSQGLNLWLWSYRSIGMATHALLCFVSMLAWRLAPWLGSVFMHCTHVMMYVRLVQAKMVHSRPLFPVSLRFFSPPYDRTKRRHISRCHQRRI